MLLTIGTPAFMVLMALMTGVAAFGCGIIHEPELAKKPFRWAQRVYAPLSWHEFLFPPCPICWAARAGVLLAIGVVSVNLL